MARNISKLLDFATMLLKEDVVMRPGNFAPLFRSTVGFDRLLDLVDETARPNWPPYNIEKSGDANYRIRMAVAGFGAATLVFAVSQNIWLSAGALFLTGAFDSVSVIIRQTVIYYSTPDHMRGISSVHERRWLCAARTLAFGRLGVEGTRRLDSATLLAG